ncbi:hypothetical protein NT04LM_4301a, partial [Listeria monocytogenes FSL F2-208]
LLVVSMYLDGFSMAESKVASLNLAGGFVFPVSKLIRLTGIVSPFFILVN